MSLVEKICDAAELARIRRYWWPDRGYAPMGYIKGMAVSYGLALQGLAAGTASYGAMADDVGQPDRDALAYYAPEFTGLNIGMNSTGARLRGLFALLFGLGMRESSGQYCEGRDMSADNVSALTAEAGLFQASYNSVSASPLLRPIFDEYRGRTDLREIFSEGVSCGPSSWMNYGQGDGRDFQELSKACPRFAVDYCAVALRHQRRHWGPINHKHAELRPEAFELLSQVERILAAEPAVGAQPYNAPAFAAISPLVQSLVTSAQAEWTFFGRSTRSLSNEWHIGGDEANEPYTTRVGRYWRAVGDTVSDGDTPKPWSAAFISWLFQNADVDETIFKPNAGHSDYIRHIYRHPGALQLNPPAAPVGVGSLIWNAREGSVADHEEAVAKLVAGESFVSHCDLVVEVGDGWCHSIGGNVSNRDPGGSVTRSTWKLDAEARLADRRKVWIGVISNGL